MATNSSDLDPVIKSALTHLHSSSQSSATEIRILLDGLLKKQFGSSKMLINRLSKKQLEEEETAPGIVALPEPLEILDSPPPPEDEAMNQDDVEEVTECLNLNLLDNDPEEATEDIEMNEDFNDLNCVVCESMRVSAANRLMECADCHSLYHQQCHSPTIEEDVLEEWTCSSCKEKSNLIQIPTPNITDQPTNIPTKSSSSSSAPSSASSSPHHRSTEIPPLVVKQTQPSTSKSSSSSSVIKEDKTSSKVDKKDSTKSERSSSSSGKKHKSSKSSHSKDHHEKKSKKSK